METGEGVGDATVAVFHIDDNEIVTGETSDLGEGRGEAEEEETVKGFAIVETGFESLGIDGVIDGEIGDSCRISDRSEGSRREGFEG